MRRYSSYKDSGVEWIGEIPNEWSVKRMSYLFRPTSVKNTEGEINLSVYRDYGVIPRDSRDDNHNVVSEDISNYKLVEIGDFVLNKMKCWMGSLGLSEYRGIVSPSYTVMKPLTNDNSKFLHYLLRSPFYIPQYRRLSYGVRIGQWDLRFEDFRDLSCILPSKSEQEQIVSYLDRKTEGIDKLIQTKVRKIELLKDYRTSLISKVVTKGLNPNVEMKDSGVEWIGEIPKGWGVKRLKNVSDIKPSNVDKHIFSDEIQVRLCNYTDVYYNDFISESTELKFGSCNRMEFEKFRLEKGDVIITKDSESPDDIGIPCLVKDDFEDVVCGYHLTLIRPQTMDGGFVFRFIQSDRTRRYFEIHSNGITRHGLGKSSIENLFLPFPPLSEQEQIVSYLDEQTQLIDKKIQTEERKIELLKEFRQSLISEVVTGKIKVCNDEEVH